MLRVRRIQICAVPIIAAAAAASAQLYAPAMGSGLPAISRISAANAAGVLQYCQGKGLVSSSSSDAALDNLPERPDIKSGDYAAGVRGQIHADSGKSFSISTVSQDLQLEACDMVLRRAKSFKKR